MRYMGTLKWKWLVEYARAPACGSPRARCGCPGSLRDPWACPKQIKSVERIRFILYKQYQVEHQHIIQIIVKL